METKAKYAAVGAFVLGFIIFIAGFLIWVSGFHFSEKEKSLDIVFTRVSPGLTEGSSVRYQGLQIGTVRSIGWDPQAPTHMLVRVSIDADISIKTDVVASMELQGITGGSFIQFSGGTAQAPDIKFTKNDIPRIQGKSSQLDNVLDSAPGVINDFSSLAEDLRGVFSSENKKVFSEILTNIRDITAAFKGEDTGVDGKHLRAQVNTIVEHATSAFKEIELAAKDARHMLSENRDSLKGFASTGLTNLSKFLNTAKETLDTFKRVSEAIERSPARFLSNDPDRGVRLR